MAAAPGSSARRNARMPHESTTAVAPVLIGLDLGEVLGLELRERVAGMGLQTAVQAVDGISGAQRREAHRAISDLFDGKLCARHPPEPLADELGDHDLPLAGDPGLCFHKPILP